MMRRKQLSHFCTVLVVLVRLLFSPEAVVAQAPMTGPELHIVEPIVTEETMPNEPGDWDLRFSGAYSWRGTEGFGVFPRAQLFFGLADRWGGEIELPLAFAKMETNQYGLGDISASVKYLLRKPGVRIPGFVLGLETAFPSGSTSKGLGEGAFEAAPFVAIVHASRWAVLQGNFGYSAVHRIRTTDASNQIFYNAAVAFPLERLKACLLWEINGAHGPGGSQVALSPGLKYNLTPDRYLAVAFPIGLNSQTPRLGFVLQLQIALRSVEAR